MLKIVVSVLSFLWLLLEMYLRERGVIRDPRPNDWYDRMHRRFD